MMSRYFRYGLLCLVILAGLLLAWGMVQAAPGYQAVPPATPTHLPDQPASYSPEVSTIDSPAPTCELPQPGTGDCYLTWSYLYADADPNYMITMTVSIDDQPRARYHGFFQTYMYIPTEMLAFRVSCGSSGSGGLQDFGRSHSYTLRARDSAGSKTANYGTVICPADTLHMCLPMVWK